MSRDRWIAGGLAAALIALGVALELGRRRRNPSQRAERSRAWRLYRGEVVASKSRAQAARRKRDAELKKIRARCETRRAVLKQACAADRHNTRAEANRAIAREKAWREEKREDYAFKMGRARRAAEKRPRMSAAENDSLAEHNIPPELVELWREMASQFPRKHAPDHRAELFMEWVEEHPDEVIAWRAERVEDDPQAFAAAYEAYAAEQEGVPF